MSGKVPSRVRITRTQRNTPKYGGNPMSAGLISCGFGRNRVICQKIKSRTAAAVTPPRPKSPVTDLNFLKTIDLWSAGGSNQATVVSQFGAIGDWDTSAVTNMAEAFKNGRNSTLGGTLDTTTFNEDISGWNTTAVQTMESMFKGATSFDQPILGSLTDTGTGANAWDTSSVTTMESMFEGATNFTNGGALLGGGAGSGSANYSITAKLGSASGVSCKAMFKNALTTANFDGLFSPIDAPGNKNEIFKNCNDMSSLFEGCTQFNKNISKLVTDNCENMSAMFKDCTIFNHDIHPNNNGGAGTWKTDNVENMSSMFENASAFNNGESGINVYQLVLVTSSVKDMSSMFNGAAAFNNKGNDLNWDRNTGSVTDMSSMFEDATAFNASVFFWDTTSVINMSSMFKGATAFNKVISVGSNTGNPPQYNYWQTDNVTDMSSMFEGATTFNVGPFPSAQLDINTAAVTDMSNMFNGATVFNRNLEHWDISSITTSANLKNCFNGSAVNQTFSDTTGGGTWFTTAQNLAAVADIPNFYTNGDDYDGNPATATQEPELTA